MWGPRFFRVIPGQADLYPNCTNFAFADGEKIGDNYCDASEPQPSPNPNPNPIPRNWLSVLHAGRYQYLRVALRRMTFVSCLQVREYLAPTCVMPPEKSQPRSHDEWFCTLFRLPQTNCGKLMSNAFRFIDCSPAVVASKTWFCMHYCT